jgi:hypothetical protein
VDIFQNELGFSPFVGFYRGLSPVIGAIKGKQVDMFKRLVENSRWNLPIVHCKNLEEKGKILENKRSHGINKYYFSSLKALQKFSKGRQSVDKLGNNIMHHIFYIKE